MRDIYTSIDIGTSSIKITVMEYYNEKFNVLAATSGPSSGVKKGLIVDANLVSAAIKKVIKQAESILGSKIDKALAVVPSNNMKIEMSSSKVKNDGDNKLITGDLIFSAMEKSLKEKVDDDFEITGVFPVEYTLEDGTNVTNPLGLEGDSFTLKDVIQMVPSKNVLSVVSILKNIGIEVVDVSTTGVCNYYAAKTRELDSKVSAIIDIGEEQTNISIFNKGIIIKDSIMPVGAKNIDTDICFTYNVSEDVAKKLKLEFAVANRKYADNDEFIEIVNKNNEKDKINQYKLADLIETRVVDMLKNAKTLINNLTNKEIGYIIVCGGISSMLGFNATVEEVYSSSASILNVGIIGVRGSGYASCVGLTKYFVDKLNLREKEYTMFSDDSVEVMLSTRKKIGNNNNVLGKIFGKIFD